MMWGCMMWEGIGYGCKIDGRMDGELQYTHRFCKMNSNKVWNIIVKMLLMLFFSRIMIPNTS